jgi:bifunctional DNA-binding transcriptional regulator/antitoxin component of YhaV-PrlF toxin-antitoxin module
MGEITTLSKASSKIESLRTAIPKSLVRFMKLNEGDKLDWDLKAQDNKIILIVTKVEKKVRNEPKRRG